ncbi:MAG: GNAT family N-acetyltransferase [bacterium]|nr:GNAT family N-acetyltransferase [bacterium]
MHIHIRPAAAADAWTIRRMVLREGLDPTTLKWQHFLVAEHAGEIIGVGQIKRYGGLEELGSLVVKKPHRGRGIAAQLIAALEAQASRPLYLACAAHLRTFYEQFGYQVIPLDDAPRALRWKLRIPNMLPGITVYAMRKL